MAYVPVGINEIKKLHAYTKFPSKKKFHFRIPTYKSNYAYINTIIRCMDITNKVINDVDIFANVSLFTFKYKLVIALDQLTCR